MMVDDEADWWTRVAWICRYTSLRPDDIPKMSPVAFQAFCTKLNEMLESESGKGQE